jgi:hypothetical protein
MHRADNDFELGSQQNQNTANNNWWNYDLGRERNSLQGAEQENTFNNAQGRLGLDWYNARTNRGNAQSQDWERRDTARRQWQGNGPMRSRFDDLRPEWAR